MFDIKTVLIIFGIVFIMVVFTRKAIGKSKTQPSSRGISAQTPTPAVKQRMTEEQFNKTWKNLSYLMLLAGAGNLYMMYNSIKGALATQSYLLWMDAVLSLAAAVIAVFVWRLHLKNLVIAYLLITILPIMVFMSTGHSMDGMTHLFPLVLVYFAVKPVWENLD